MKYPCPRAYCRSERLPFQKKIDRQASAPAVATEASLLTPRSMANAIQPTNPKTVVSRRAVISPLCAAGFFSKPLNLLIVDVPALA